MQEKGEKEIISTFMESEFKKCSEIEDNSNQN